MLHFGTLRRRNWERSWLRGCGGLRHNRRYHLVTDACGFQCDDPIRRCVISSCRSVNRRNNQIVRQTGFDQFNDCVIVECLLGKEQGADCQKYDCENLLAHGFSPSDSKPPKLFRIGDRIIHPSPCISQEVSRKAINPGQTIRKGTQQRCHKYALHSYKLCVMIGPLSPISGMRIPRGYGRLADAGGCQTN